MIGTVRKYINEAGYGFVRADDGSGDLFFHIRNVPRGVLPEVGMRVEYEIGIHPKTGRPEAQAVVPI